MKPEKQHFLRKYWWESLLIVLYIVGLVLGIIGFEKTGKSFVDALYDTFRLFFLSIQFKCHLPWQMEIARWFIFAVFIVVSCRLFITITAPRFFQYMQIRRYKNHIIICGLNATGLELINRLGKAKIVVIVSKDNPYMESLKQRSIKWVNGDPADKAILKIANALKANQLYAITDNDTKNVEIAQSAFFMLQANHQHKTEPLQCYTLISDSKLKTILEETALFKYTLKQTEQFYFDGILFNINEMGIKYGLCMNIDKVLSRKPDSAPELLIIGLTGKAGNVILDLAHCLTMTRKSFRFTVIESNRETIAAFKLEYAYLQDFATIEYRNDIKEACENKTFTTVFVCLENQIESIKTAISVRNIIANNQPDIFTFSEESELLNEVLNAEGYKILPLKDRNIFLVNTLEETIQYIVKLNPLIETLAETAHNLWRKKDESGRFVEKDGYSNLPGHFKQTNRNQVLDNYLRTFIATGKKLDTPETDSTLVFSAKDKETLAMMEHRRWMIEKYNNGWRYGEKRDNQFKIHTDLIPWENLPESEKQKDYCAIDLMINRLNQQNV